MSIVLDHGHTWERPSETGMFQPLSDMLSSRRPWWNPLASDTYRTRIHVPLLFDHVCVGFVQGDQVDRTVTSELTAWRDKELIVLQFTDFTREEVPEPIQVKAPLIRQYTDTAPGSAQLLDGLVVNLAPDSPPTLQGIIKQEAIDVQDIDANDAVSFARACVAHLPYHA